MNAVMLILNMFSPFGISIKYFAFDLHVNFTPKHEIFILAATTSERNTKPHVSGSE